MMKPTGNDLEQKVDTLRTNHSKGFLTLKIDYTQRVIVGYRIENGQPVLKEEDILLIVYSRGNEHSYARLCFRGDNYKFLRYKLLEDSTENANIRISRDNARKLKDIVDKMLGKRFR